MIGPASNYRKWLPVCFFLYLLPLRMEASAQQDAKPRYRVRVEVVSIDVEVLDDEENPVLDLAQDDFVVKENGKKVKITNFARFKDRPVSLALLLDTSTIELKKLNIAKEFMLDIIHLLDRNDDICLYSFDNRDAYLEADYTVDRPLLATALENIAVSAKRRGGFLAEFLSADPASGLGTDRALRSQARSAHPKKAVLIISNRFRGLGPATADHVRESGCTIYTLGFDNKSAVIASMGGDQISKKRLMGESGGRKFSAETGDIMGVSRAIAASMKNYYSIGYQADPDRKDAKPRRIEVRIPRHKYIIHAQRSVVINQ